MCFIVEETWTLESTASRECQRSSGRLVAVGDCMVDCIECVYLGFVWVRVGGQAPGSRSGTGGGTARAAFLGGCHGATMRMVIKIRRGSRERDKNQCGEWREEKEEGRGVRARKTKGATQRLPRNRR